MKLIMPIVLFLLSPFWSAFDLNDSYLRSIPLYSDYSPYANNIYKQDLSLVAESGAARELINPKAFDFHLFNACLFYASNKCRQTNGKSSLAFDANLRDAASIHSYNMVKFDFFSHENARDKRFRDLSDRIEFVGMDVQYISENIAKSWIDASDPPSYLELAYATVDQWMQSPPHKANLLNPKLDALGCAAYFYPDEEDEGIYYFVATQDFCRYWH